MAVEIFPIFQVDRQQRHVQNDRHFLAGRKLLGFAIYLENAAERLPLHANRHQQKGQAERQSLQLPGCIHRRQTFSQTFGFFKGQSSTGA